MNHRKSFRMPLAATSVAPYFLIPAIATIVIGCRRTATPPPPPRPEVEVATVVQKNVPVYSEWVGTTEGFVNAQIFPKISGYLLKQNYKDGEQVKAGKLLFQID